MRANPWRWALGAITLAAVTTFAAPDIAPGPQPVAAMFFEPTQKATNGTATTGSTAGAAGEGATGAGAGGAAGEGAAGAGAGGTGAGGTGAVGAAHGAAAGASMTAGASRGVTPSAASIGVLSSSADLSRHGCTASVVASAGGEVIVTAAHCVSGSGAGDVFAPGYRSGEAPFGTWVVRSAYVPAGWLKDQNPQDDVAFLTVTPAASNPSAATVQSVVGGYPLAAAPQAGTTVRVTGYVSRAPSAVTCTATVYETKDHPSFDCAGFQGGTSGGPWITDGTLTAVIGGLHQGGCSPNTSYSSTFDTTTAATLTRATTGSTPDVLPAPHSDGC